VSVSLAPRAVRHCERMKDKYPNPAYVDHMPGLHQLPSILALSSYDLFFL
jgi:hypothetical protein